MVPDEQAEDWWPSQAGQRIWSNHPEAAGDCWVHCVLCGEAIPVVEDDEFMLFVNGVEAYIVHHLCGSRLNEARKRMLAESELQDRSHKRRKPS